MGTVYPTPYGVSIKPPSSITVKFQEKRQKSSKTAGKNLKNNLFIIPAIVDPNLGFRLGLDLGELPKIRLGLGYIKILEKSTRNRKFFEKMAKIAPSGLGLNFPQRDQGT